MQYGFVEVISLLLLNTLILLLLLLLLKFKSIHFAEHAILSLNGKSFKGRTLRLNFASYKSEQLVSMDQMLVHGYNSFNNTNSVHVKFVSTVKSKKRNAVITEELLTQIFTIFGEVVDCAIKESAFDKVNNYQYGYAFVHFAEINGALTAAGVYSNSHLDHIGMSIKCTLSKNLMRSMATTLNINSLPYMFNQFEGPHHPYIMGYENYGPLPPSPYMINGINHHINPWNEFSELHSDPVNVTDLMHPIQMMPMVSNDNNIINFANLENIGYEYYMDSSNDYVDFRGNYNSNQ
jgi:RNA recognition motif-containing protein